jgi:hypothetical protein
MLKELLLQLFGAKGAQALSPLLKNEALAAFIAPRAITSWLRKASYGQLQLKPFEALMKTGYGYNGSITLKEVPYVFDKATEEQVAAMVSVSLDQKIEPTIKDLDLAKLSKTLDLLLKAQPKYEPKESISNAAPKLAPIQAMDKQPPVVARVKRRGFVKTMLVTDKESKQLCKMCGKSQFEKGEFKGCTCLRSLAKSVKCSLKNCNYLLTFGSDCGIDELMTVAEAIGRI